jgi:hypothetical protein
MKEGDIFAFADHELKVFDMGLVDEVKETETIGYSKIVVQSYWPHDSGELREFPTSNPYYKRNQQIFHSKSPGIRIREARHQIIMLVCNGSVRV